MGEARRLRRSENKEIPQKITFFLEQLREHVKNKPVINTETENPMELIEQTNRVGGWARNRIGLINKLEKLGHDFKGTYPG
jgi:hypothetical protein